MAHLIDELVDSVESDIDELNSFNASDEQLEAIARRDHYKCYSLGMSLNEYLYMISPKYRFRLNNLR